MSREQKVINYYVLCNKLKDLIRTGWTTWNVKRDRIESVAEHIYGVQQLAIAMKYEYGYDIDLLKVIFMLAIHETEEIFIGDLTQFQISREEKKEMGHKAVRELFGKIINGDQIENIILEFDERKTPEAVFAYQCDKLECDLQAKIYDEENCVNLDEQEGNETLKNEYVQQLFNSGMSWGEMWLTFGQKTYSYDENFRSVSNYAKDNRISSK